MREIGPAKPRDERDPGEVFYTIRKEDAGKTVIQTEIGPVNVSSFLGTVLREDVGRRIYRVQNNARDSWLWVAEANSQRYEREAREREKQGDSSPGAST